MHYLESGDIRELIEDEESGFFKNIIKILGDYHEELYYYKDDFYIGDLEFFSICKLIDKDLLKILLISVINDDTITSYQSIFEEGLINKFFPSELVNILESLDIERLKTFLISLAKVYQYFSFWDLNDDEDNDETYRILENYNYIEKLEKYLSSSLKNSIIKIITDSDPSDRRPIRRSLRKLGWFKPKPKRLIEKLRPVEAGDYYAIGIQELSLKNYETALQYFNKALELKPEYVMMWINKGETLKKLGRINEALECFDQALVLDPHNRYAKNLKKKSFESL